MKLQNLARQFICLGVLCLTLLACDQPEQAAERPAGVPASSLTVFDLTPEEKSSLSVRALGGDAEASFRLAEFYTFAGGDGDPNINDDHDRREERRWLELATEQGHRTAKFNLAVSIAKDDCPRARAMMNEIIDEATDPEQRRYATGWLKEPRFAC